MHYMRITSVWYFESGDQNVLTSTSFCHNIWFSMIKDFNTLEDDVEYGLYDTVYIKKKVPKLKRP